MYGLLEAALVRNAGDQLRFSFWSGEPLAGEIEEQMSILLREYKTVSS